MRERKKLPLTEDRLVEFIRERDWVSFAELKSHFRGASGDLCMGCVYANVYTALNVSEKLAEVVNAAIEKERIYGQTCSVMVYMVDGELANIPLARSARHYKKPRWLPMALRPGKAPAGLGVELGRKSEQAGDS